MSIFKHTQLSDKTEFYVQSYHLLQSNGLYFLKWLNKRNDFMFVDFIDV